MQNSTKKILLVAGARPNFMKLAPLYNELKKNDRYQPLVVHTGQHYDRQMSDVFFDQLELPKPDIYLGIGSGTHGLQTGKILIEIEKVLLDEKPDMVVVFGDVNSTLAAAVAAVKLQIPIAHVEAGLRSNDWSMPEEINRLVADRLSTLLFTTCEDANVNLLNEGATEDQIRFVGNIMIDSLCRYLPKLDDFDASSMPDVKPGDYILVTMHRPGNVDNEKNLKKTVRMLDGLTDIAPVVFPIHPRTRKKLIEFELADSSEKILEKHNLHLTEPLGYLEFVRLERDAGVVVTDSGGVQEETTYLGVPCLTVRPNTERPVTITDGTNELIGLDPEKVIHRASAHMASEHSDKRCPLLWDGRTAERIVEELDRFFEIVPEALMGVSPGKVRPSARISMI